MSLRHVEQRLSERAWPAAADRGFALLRDAASLVRFLERQAEMDPALAGVEEVALPLAEGDDPPRLVVSRQGRGITCLGSGMTTPAPTLAFADVQAHLDARARALQTQAALARDDEKDGALRSLPRAFELAYRLTRAELDDLRALGPLVGPVLFQRCVAVVDEVYGWRKSLKRWPLKSAEAAEAAWRRYTSACVGLLALDEHPALEQLCFSCLATGDAQLSVRALWLLANRPERTLDALDALLAGEDSPAVAGLGSVVRVIASRFPDLRGRCRRVWLAAAERGQLDEAQTSALDDDVELPAFAVVFLSALPLLLLRHPPPGLHDEEARQRFLVTTAQAQQEALAQGLGLGRAAERMGPWTRRVVELLDPLRHVRARQGWRRGSDVGGDKPERVRLVLWRAILRDLRMPALALPVEVLAFLTSAPLDAVLPPARPDVVWRLRAGREYMQVLLPQLLGS